MNIRNLIDFNDMTLEEWAEIRDLAFDIKKYPKK